MADVPEPAPTPSDLPTIEAPVSPAVAPAPGTVLGGYRLDSLIAVGGIGRVYRATDDRLGRTVALKVIHVAGDPHGRERFLREVRLIAGFQHPHIVLLYGAGEERGWAWAAMELLAGSLFDELRQRGRLTAAEAALAGRHACSGLDAAAARGIIHRDVKPSNLLRDRSGTVKVSDFGLAKDLSLDLHLTSPGAILGTPLYTSPEQATGKAVGVRSDLYSLGATLYHLVAGRPPFESSNTLDVLVRHAVEPPPPLPADVPAGLSRLIFRLLAKDPAQRPADYAATVQSLESCLSEEPGVEPEPALESTARERGDAVSASLVGAARAALEMGRTERAHTLLDPLIQKRSAGWVTAAFLLASAFEAASRFAEAARLLEQVRAQAGAADDRALALWMLGRLAERESSAALDRAVSYYQQIGEVSSTRFPRALLDARIARLASRQKQEGSSAGNPRDPQIA
jgi:serine/threonine protein kinase